MWLIYGGAFFFNKGVNHAMRCLNFYFECVHQQSRVLLPSLWLKIFLHLLIVTVLFWQQYLIALNIIRWLHTLICIFVMLCIGCYIIWSDNNTPWKQYEGHLKRCLLPLWIDKLMICNNSTSTELQFTFKNTWIWLKRCLYVFVWASLYSGGEQLWVVSAGGKGLREFNLFFCSCRALALGLLCDGSVDFVHKGYSYITAILYERKKNIRKW